VVYSREGESMTNRYHRQIPKELQDMAASLAFFLPKL
jgi:hypothetical protein